MAIIAAHNCRVFFGDVEVTRMVHDFQLNARVGEVISAVVQFFAVPDVQRVGDHVFVRFPVDGRPEVATPERAIRLRADIEGA